MGLINTVREKLLAANRKTAKEWTFEWMKMNE
jgi:hypothetical protein